jgi:cell division protein FtsB
MDVMVLFQFPKRVFLFCFLIFLVWIFATGYIFQAYRLHVLNQTVTERLNQVQSDIKNLEVQIGRLQDREFIRKQAIENLDLAGEQDLIFLFPQ